MSLLGAWVYNILSVLFMFIFILLIAKFFLGWNIIKFRKKDYIIFSCAVLNIIFLALMCAFFYTAGLFKKPFYIFEIITDYLTTINITLFMQSIFKKGWLKSWVATIFLCMLFNFSEYIILIFLPGFQFHIAILHEFLLYILYSFLVTPLIEIILILLLSKTEAGRITRHRINNYNSSPKKNILLSLYPATIYIANTINSENLIINKYSASTIITILIINIILAYMEITEIQKQKLEAQQINIQQQNIYIKNLEEIQLEIHRFRHDYKNMMSGMYLSAKEGDIKAVQNFIQDMTSDFEHQAGSQIHKFTQLGNIHIMELKGLLLNKMELMKSKHIKCELEVLRPLLYTTLHGTDLCRCFGILIDNAIDEVCGKQNAYVNIMISRQEGFTTFRVKNTLYSEIDFHKIWFEGYSTKGEGRGTGLANYKKILERYDNVFPHTSVQNGYFIQELKIQE